MTPKIAVIDDESNIRKTIQMTLELEDFEVSPFRGSTDFLEALTTQEFSLAIIDICLEGVSGIDLFHRIKELGYTLPVIFISGNATLKQAAQAIQLGAFDFIEKPISSERLIVTVERCLENSRLRQRIEELQSQSTKGQIIGDSPVIRDCIMQAKRVARSDANVLLDGESGTGKELFASLIHQHSARSKKPIIKVNCSAIPENLIESQLFGHKRGAFTGANSDYQGFFDQARGGTLFLDEIGDMNIEAQAKVLRAIQEREIQPIGSEQSKKVDVRVIAASHRDLKSRVASGDFREDLYFRISTIPISIPPLRERKGDVLVLTHFFLDQLAQKNNLVRPKVLREVLECLAEYSWPGNVRELQNIIERMIIMGGDRLSLADVPLDIVSPPKKSIEPTSSDQALTLEEYKKQMERKYIVSTLKSCNGNVSQAAKVLGLERTHLHKKINQAEIAKREYFL